MFDLSLTGDEIERHVTTTGDPAAEAPRSPSSECIAMARTVVSSTIPLQDWQGRLAILVARIERKTKILGQHELMIQLIRTVRALNERNIDGLAAHFSNRPVRQPAQSTSPLPLAR